MYCVSLKQHCSNGFEKNCSRIKVRLKLQVWPPLDSAIRDYFLQQGKPKTLGARITQLIDNDECLTFYLCGMNDPDTDAANVARSAGYVTVNHEDKNHQVWRNNETPPTYVQRKVSKYKRSGPRAKATFVDCYRFANPADALRCFEASRCGNKWRAVGPLEQRGNKPEIMERMNE